MPLIDSFLQNAIIFVILVGVAGAGIFFGKMLRSKSDAKKAAESFEQEDK